MNIKDYLHLYLGCEVYQKGGLPVKLTPDLLTASSFTEGLSKPILRPLSDMTEDYFLSLFKISIGAAEDMIPTSFSRLATDDLLVQMGYGQYKFSYRHNFENDVRIEGGVSFYIECFKIENRISISSQGIEESKSPFNPSKENRIVWNQATIFKKLLKDGYDLFGLIEAGLAIDKTKITANGIS